MYPEAQGWMRDWCPMCRRYEDEHTDEELRVCWAALALDVDLSERPDMDAIPPQEM
jgi:hypothetical protein